MEKTIYNRLKKYEKNYKYILSTNKIFPALFLYDRKELIRLYNEIFSRDERVELGCTSCGGKMEMILRELAKYYYANTATESTETVEHQDTGVIETLSSVPTADEIAKRGDRDGQTVICDENYAEHNKCEQTPPVKKRSHHKKK